MYTISGYNDKAVEDMLLLRLSNSQKALQLLPLHSIVDVKGEYRELELTIK